jgi:hypothetical protein
MRWKRGVAIVLAVIAIYLFWMQGVVIHHENVHVMIANYYGVNATVEIGFLKGKTYADPNEFYRLSPEHRLSLILAQSVLDAVGNSMLEFAVLIVLLYLFDRFVFHQ